MKKLIRNFYNRDSITVAKDLLGKVLVHKVDGKEYKGIIVEVEAYCGFDDKAAHSYGGKRTPRVEVMYGEPGFSYIYLIYGMYNCFNIVTGKNNQAQAVLIRALEPIEGIEIMQEYRKQSKIKMLCNGPGKLCQAFGINRALNGISLLKPPIYLEFTI